jgi:hypothetical protein
MPANAWTAEVDALTSKALLRKDPLKGFCVPLNTSAKPVGGGKKEYMTCFIGVS